MPSFCLQISVAEHVAARVGEAIAAAGLFCAWVDRREPAERAVVGRELGVGVSGVVEHEVMYIPPTWNSAGRELVLSALRAGGAR